MNREMFLEKIADALQTDEKISFTTVLEDLEDWDSLSKMAVMAFINQTFDVNITFASFDEIKQIEDLAKKVGI